jgi:hypothetical protein
MPYSTQVNLAVISAREAGFSWTAIGMALGVSKQTAMQRFSKLVEAGVRYQPADEARYPRDSRA